MWTGERDSPQVEHFQAATESVEKKHRKEERAISSQRWDESVSLQPCKHAVQSGRHTPCLPAPPALPPSPASDKNPFSRGPGGFVAGSGITKGLWAAGRGTCSYPRGSRSPGTCPAVAPTARIGSLSPAFPAAEASHSSARRERPCCYCPSSPNAALAPSGTCWPTESKSPLPSSQNRGGLMLTDTGEEEPARPAAHGTKRAALGNDKPQTSQRKALRPSASKTNLAPQGLERDQTVTGGGLSQPGSNPSHVPEGKPLQSAPRRACGAKVLLCTPRHPI